VLWFIVCVVADERRRRSLTIRKGSQTMAIARKPRKVEGKQNETGGKIWDTKYPLHWRIMPGGLFNFYWFKGSETSVVLADEGYTEDDLLFTIVDNGWGLQAFSIEVLTGEDKAEHRDYSAGEVKQLYETKVPFRLMRRSKTRLPYFEFDQRKTKPKKAPAKKPALKKAPARKQ